MVGSRIPSPPPPSTIGDSGPAFGAAVLLVSRSIGSLNGDVKERDEEDPRRRGQEHATENGRAERLAAGGARSRGDHQRDDAKDERDRRHQDRAEAEPRRLDRRLHDRLALLLKLLGELDDQDGGLGREADEQHEPDLHVDVVLQPAQPCEHGGPQDGERHGEQHGERDAPALVLGRQEEEDKDDREPEDQRSEIAGGDLLEGDPRPLVAHLAGQTLGRDPPPSPPPPVRTSSRRREPR